MEKGPEKKSLFSRNIKNHLRVIRHAGIDDAQGEKSGKIFDRYDFYDSPPMSYDQYFHDVLGNETSLRTYIERIYPEKKGELIGIELGGPGSNLFRGFPGAFKKTAGFVLTDVRNESQKTEDAKINHAVVEADVFFRKGAAGRSFSSVETWIEKNGKADVLIERMVEPLHMIRRREIFTEILKRWFTLSADEGSMFIELPNMMPPEQLRGLKEDLKRLAEENNCELALDMDSKQHIKVVRFKRRKAVEK